MIVLRVLRVPRSPRAAAIHAPNQTFTTLVDVHHWDTPIDFGVNEMGYPIPESLAPRSFFEYVELCFGAFMEFGNYSQVSTCCLLYCREQKT